jgi:putative membrane protein
MKQALRGILVNSLAIALAAMIIPGIKYGQNITALLIAAIALGIANTFIRPVLSLVLLPINIITLGIAGLFMNTLLLFLATLVVPSFTIVPFSIPWGDQTLFISIIWSYIISSFIISAIANLVRSIVSD